MMAIAAWLVWRSRGFHDGAGALGIFALQLALNALWSPLFLGCEIRWPDSWISSLVGSDSSDAGLLLEDLAACRGANGAITGYG